MANAIYRMASLLMTYLFISSRFVKVRAGNAILSLKFQTFSNFNGLTKYGECCDGQGNTACTSKCDHSFDVCVSSQRRESLMKQCPFGRFVTGGITDENYIQFGSTIGESNNPLLFPIKTWPPKIFLSVDVVDKDTPSPSSNDDQDNEDDEVARLERTIILPPNNITKTILLRNRVELSMEVRGFCAPNYYGLECGVFCSVQDGEDQRYWCDEKGRKLCHLGWTGQACNENIDECASSPCSHGGTCIDLINDYKCECPHQYTGLTCQLDTNECESMTAVCFNGTCVNEIGSFWCKCHVGFTGPRCEEDINECHPSPCRHGGVCSESKTPGEFFCTCPVNFTGHFCEVNVNECISATHNQPICQHNGTCVDTFGSFHCDCSPSWTGKFCQSNADECAISSILNQPICQHNGICVDTFGSFYCNCSSFWTGEFCERDVDECTSFSEGPCFGNGTKSCRNIDEGFECICAEGWVGNFCDEDIDECKIVQELCLNSGTCSNLEGSFKCECRRGWSGERCGSDVDECDDSDDIVVCKNGGTCVNLPGGFACHCSEFWIGENCDIDIDECMVGKCSSNTTKSCHNFPGGFHCVCYEGWSGRYCEDDIDECDVNRMVCLDGFDYGNDKINITRSEREENFKGGKSENGVERSMLVSEGSKGRNSDNITWEKNWEEIIELSFVHNKTTSGNFVCRNTVPGYACSCAVGWTGRKCDVVLEYEYVTEYAYLDIVSPQLDDLHTGFSTESSSSDASILWAAFVLPLIVIMVAVLAVLVFLRKRRQKTLEVNRVTYVNEAFVDRTSTMPRVNGYHNGNHSAPVEIPHLCIERENGERNEAPTNAEEEKASPDTTSSPGNVDIHFHYEVPENEDDEEVADLDPGSNDNDDVIVCRPPKSPPTPEVKERSRSEDVFTAPENVENAISEETVVKETCVMNMDSGIFVVGSDRNSETVYVSRVDLVINDGNVLSQSHPTQEDGRYEHLPYIDAPLVEDRQ